MIKKTITYEDFNGDTRTEDFRFHLSETELTMLESSVDGGFDNMIKQMAATKDAPKIMKTFEKIILASYGVISLDGKRFEKSEELARAFMQTPAYDILFMELLKNGEEMAKFVNGILPKNIQERMAKEGTTLLPNNA